MPENAIENNYIVFLKTTFGKANVVQIASDYGGVKVNAIFYTQNLHGFAAIMNKTTLQKCLEDDRVPKVFQK